MDFECVQNVCVSVYQVAYIIFFFFYYFCFHFYYIVEMREKDW